MPYKDPEKRKEANRKSKQKHREKILESQKKYREENYERIKENHKIWRDNNQDKIKESREKTKEQMKEWFKKYREQPEIKEKLQEKNKEKYKNNKEQNAEKCKEYRENNKDKIAVKQKEWRNNNQERIKEYSKCKSCKLFQTKHPVFLCSYCNPDKPDFIKKREVELKTFLEENNYQFEYNKFCKYQDKWYYPDFKIKSTNGNFWIIIECDERAHKDYEKNDEIERQKNICLGLNLPCIFLRYNPDKKKINMKIKQKILKSYIEYYKNKCNQGNDVCYLFY